MKIQFNNQNIIITGATRGIGRKISEDLYNLGANLFLTGTNLDEITNLNQINIERKRYFHLDFNDLKSVQLFIKEIESIDQIDCLINNAGINILNSISDVEMSDWSQMLNVNLTGPLCLIKHVSNIMKNRNYGRILNIGSIFGKISKEKRIAYSATKFGLHGITVGASIDLAKFNILINTLSPGFILTELTYKNLTENEILKISLDIPIKRLGEPEDISNCAIFLLSKYNTYITGQNIIADGGFTNI